MTCIVTETSGVTVWVYDDERLSRDPRVLAFSSTSPHTPHRTKYTRTSAPRIRESPRVFVTRNQWRESRGRSSDEWCLESVGSLSRVLVSICSFFQKSNLLWTVKSSNGTDQGDGNPIQERSSEESRTTLLLKPTEWRTRLSMWLNTDYGSPVIRGTGGLYLLCGRTSHLDDTDGTRQ